MASIDLPPDFEVELGTLASAIDFATAIGAASSRSAARRLIEQGGLTVNDLRIADPQAAIAAAGNGALRVRVGKKRVLLGRVRA
jgi:tyrosyl-tRNA synthetase